MQVVKIRIAEAARSTPVRGNYRPNFCHPQRWLGKTADGRYANGGTVNSDYPVQRSGPSDSSPRACNRAK